jgi:hypothetical protein
MTRNPMLAALIFGPFLSAVLSAQDQPIPIAPGTPVTPLTRDTPGPAILPAVPVPVVPAPPTFAHPTIPNAVQPYFPHRDFTTTIPAPPGRVVQLPTRETYTGPAKVSFDDGTTLTGEIQAHGPLDCVASFGPIAVPFNKIRGIS